MVLRDTCIEGVGGELFRTTEQAKTTRRDDPVQVTLLRTDRAIARHDALDFSVDLKGYAAAVASTPMHAHCRPPRKYAAPYSGSLRNRKALPITDTELRLMAALAIIGLSSNPNAGYSTPAATGTPRAL